MWAFTLLLQSTVLAPTSILLWSLRVTVVAFKQRDDLFLRKALFHFFNGYVLRFFLCAVPTCFHYTEFRMFCTTHETTLKMSQYSESEIPLLYEDNTQRTAKRYKPMPWSLQHSQPSFVPASTVPSQSMISSVRDDQNLLNPGSPYT